MTRLYQASLPVSSIWAMWLITRKKRVIVSPVEREWQGLQELNLFTPRPGDGRSGPLSYRPPATTSIANLQVELRPSQVTQQGSRGMNLGDGDIQGRVGCREGLEERPR